MSSENRPLQVLLADDDPDDRYLFREALLEVPTAAELTTLENGQLLLDHLSLIVSPPPPDIIFLDINMPMKTGQECLLAIRSDRKFDNTPIIMFTTSSHRHDIEESYKAGASMFISKSMFFENDVDILEKLFSINWREYLPQPAREKFVFSYQ